MKLEVGAILSKEVRISVRSLVEYVFSSGSIDSRFRSQTSLVEGTRIHQSIQKTYAKSDQKEVYLRAEIPFEEHVFIIDGRCDGLLFVSDGVTVDEIKSFSYSLEEVDEGGYPVHWAQAKMYAYMYALEHHLNDISVQLTYVQVETEEKRYLKKRIVFSELEAFALDIIKKYAPFAQLQCGHTINRNRSSLELEFPFPAYREGQRKLAGAVYKTILDKKNLFAKAPTGIGKTISTLFPTIKAIGEGLHEKIFYLTAKTITRTTAEEAFDRMHNMGLETNFVTITAKDKVCFQEETKCQPDYCPFANGYYDRINEAVLDILRAERKMTRAVIEAYSLKHSVCPFEFSLDLAYAVDAVICDYNYIFDPRVSLKRLFEEQKKSTVLLIDEAHNLVERGREMYSATINKQLFLTLKKELKGVQPEIYQLANKLNSMFIGLKKELGDQNELVLSSLEGEWLEQLTLFSETAKQALALEQVSNPSLLDAHFTVLKFLKITELVDEHYVIYAEKTRHDMVLKLFCLDPSYLLRKIGKGFRAKVFFSATLAPLPYYQEILGGKEEDYQISIPSPFKEEQVDVFIQPLSTRFSDRERTKDSIVTMLHSLLRSRPGNYLIFFPSYQYLAAVYDQYKQLDKEVNTLVQATGMKEEEREEFLAAFKPNKKGTLLGFAVLGGIFSEGVDLVGERLNGVIVVGVGLPQLCFERNLIKDHYSANQKNGYEYSYVYPGMNKVLQAGGRLIRSEADHGTIVLVDDRFLKPPYQTLLPAEWRNYTII